MFKPINDSVLFFCHSDLGGFFVMVRDDFLMATTFALYITLLAHAVFIVTIEIAFIIIKIKERFDKKSRVLLDIKNINEV